MGRCVILVAVCDECDKKKAYVANVEVSGGNGDLRLPGGAYIARQSAPKGWIGTEHHVYCSKKCYAKVR